MTRWWNRLSLKLRLAVSFTLVASAIMLGLAPVGYVMIERLLHKELDHELRVDWDLIKAHLELGESGGVRWKKASPATPSSPCYADSWFDVWSDGDLMLSHWPPHGPRSPAPRSRYTTEHTPSTTSR